MDAIVEILIVLYWSTFVAGILCGLPLGMVLTVLWGIMHRKRRQIDAEAFAKDLNTWVQEIEGDGQQNC